MGQVRRSPSNRVPPGIGSRTAPRSSTQRSAEENARRLAAEKRRKKKERKKKAQIFKGRLILFAIVFLLLAALALVVFLLFFHATPDAPDNSGTITYLYGGSEKRNADAAKLVTSNGIYLCFNDLSDYIGMAQSGTSRNMKFILTDSESQPKSSAGTGNEEYILFHTDGYNVDINGQSVQLKIPTLLIDEEVWVSTDFVRTYMNNLSVIYNAKKSTVSVSRIEDEEVSGDTTVFLPVSFTLKSAGSIPKVVEDPLLGDIVFDEEGDYDLSFTADLSEYEKYMNPSDDEASDFLKIVNADSPLSMNDIPSDLTDVKYSSGAKQTQRLRLYAAKSLEALFEEMHALGYYDMAVYCGYVSFSDQSNTFDKNKANEMTANPYLTDEEAEEIVRAYTSVPGTSEHQTGLSVDMDTMGCYTTDFQFTAEYTWLMENAWKFGFILRYPDNKTNVTGMAFEPWHFRYVGRNNALKIHESGLTLEEFCAKTKKK